VLEDDQPLTLDARSYGELVHELLKRAVDALEPSPGFAGAARHEIESALAGAMAVVSASWPLQRSVPPPLLWQHTLETAVQLALRALTLDESFQPGTRSWTELAFGRADFVNTDDADLPWSPCAPVLIPGTNIRIQGSIDRLDLTAGRNAVRVTDYKTGREPKQADSIVLRGGAELQRAIYASAVRHLVPEAPRWSPAWCFSVMIRLAPTSFWMLTKPLPRLRRMLPRRATYCGRASHCLDPTHKSTGMIISVARRLHPGVTYLQGILLRPRQLRSVQRMAAPMKP